MVNLKIAVVFYCLWTLSITVSSAAIVTIDEDTTIDASNSISGSGIEVINGPGGPATVEIVNGGIVRGFQGCQDSEIILDGGNATFLSSLSGNAKFVLRNGQLECSEAVCQVIDYDALLHVGDNSSIHVFGGAITGPISLDDNSTAHFYGRSLTLSITGNGIVIEGELANGNSGYFSIDNAPFQNTLNRVFLHTIPEPGAMALAATAVIAIAMRRIRARAFCL